MLSVLSLKAKHKEWLQETISTTSVLKALSMTIKSIMFCTNLIVIIINFWVYKKCSVKSSVCKPVLHFLLLQFWFRMNEKFHAQTCKQRYILFPKCQNSLKTGDICLSSIIISKEYVELFNFHVILASQLFLYLTYFYDNKQPCLYKPTVKPLNISPTLVSNKIVDNSDVVEASPVGAAPTTSSFST